MIGNELVWRKIKNYGKQIIITTLTQSLGTFLLVLLIFGGIALANMTLIVDLNKLMNYLILF